MSSAPTWGVVSTIKAPAKDIFNFAAHHLEMGAHRVFIYLDAPNETAMKALRDHPKCRVTLTDEGYWRRRKGRPDRHQPRQTANASHCYKRGPKVDWLAHIDVDEFLWPMRPISEQLGELIDGTRSARVWPIEAMASDPNDPPPHGTVWCKSCARAHKTRRRETNAIYPEFGPRLNGGFISHVAGKVFVRTGHKHTSVRIHNAFFDRAADPYPAPLDDVALVHLHSRDYAHFKNQFAYRLESGSYRASLKPAPLQDGEAVTIHQLLANLGQNGGEDALRNFYREVCTATPELRTRLDQYGHLHSVGLDLDAKRHAHFPENA